MSPGVDEQRWLTVRGYYSRVFRVESQLEVAGRRRRIADRKRKKYSTLSHTSPHATTSGCGCLEGLFELLFR